MSSRLSGAATACMEGSAQGGYNRAMYCEACSVSFLALVSSFRPPGQAGARRALFFVHTNVSVMVPSASGNVGHRFGLRARRVFLVARVRASVVAISNQIGHNTLCFPLGPSDSGHPGARGEPRRPYLHSPRVLVAIWPQATIPPGCRAHGYPHTWHNTPTRLYIHIFVQ